MMIAKEARERVDIIENARCLKMLREVYNSIDIVSKYGGSVYNFDVDCLSLSSIKKIKKDLKSNGYKVKYHKGSITTYLIIKW